MKIFLAILVLVACVSAEEWTIKTDDEIKDIHHLCAILHSISSEQISKIEKLDLDNVEPVRKYLVCTSVKIGVVSAEHGYYADRIAKQFKMDLSEAEAKKHAEFCIAHFYKTDEKFDVAVYAVHSCIMRTPIGEKMIFEATSIRPSKLD